MQWFSKGTKRTLRYDAGRLPIDGGFFNATTGKVGGGIQDDGKAPTFHSGIANFPFASAATTANFGSLSKARYRLTACASQKTGSRAVFMGGVEVTAGIVNTIEYQDFTSTTVTDFGDLVAINQYNDSYASDVKAYRVGGFTATVYSNVVGRVTIASPGNESSFHTLATTLWESASTNTSTFGVITMGHTGAVWTSVYRKMLFSDDSFNESFKTTSSALLAHESSGNETRNVTVGGWHVFGEQFRQHMYYLDYADDSDVTYFGLMILKRMFAGSASNQTTMLTFYGEVAESIETNRVYVISIHTPSADTLFTTTSGTSLRQQLGACSGSA